jgi:hypothetical protein
MGGALITMSFVSALSSRRAPTECWSRVRCCRTPSGRFRYLTNNATKWHGTRACPFPLGSETIAMITLLGSRRV